MKQKLVCKNNSFTAHKTTRYRHEVGGVKKKERFACFNVHKTEAFMNGLIFTADDDDGIDVGELDITPAAKSTKPACCGRL